MDFKSFFDAVILGLIEGLTEFLPISSTGHLILAVDILGFNAPPGQIFEIIIQLGAILAVCWHYREKILHTFLYFYREKESQKFTTNILIAFLPSVILGALLYGFIKSTLFSPLVVSYSLIVGGIIIIIVEKIHPKILCKNIDRITPKLALFIGLCQTISMIPGSSRAGSTIIGAMIFGVDRKTATEFSFFLAIPTIFAATLYDLYKNFELINSASLALIGVGFVTAFITASMIIKWLLHYISHHNFIVFGWYRIAVGSLMLALLTF